MTERDRNVAEALGRAIRARRERRGLSQLALARKTRVRVQSKMGLIEQGRRGLSFVDAVGISRALEISLDDLAAEVPPIELEVCGTCANEPPPGFTCNSCRTKGERDEDRS